MKKKLAIPPQLQVSEGGGSFMNNARLGMYLFVATEFMLFAGIIAGYFILRTSNNNFKDYNPLPLGFTPFNTVLLVLSSVSLFIAQKSISKNDINLFKIATYTTFILGLIFFVLQIFEWKELQLTSFYATDNNNNGMFYLLSGLHGVHVFGGILMLALLTIRASRNYFNIKRKNYVAVTGIYWHFVTALWLLLFLILFVI
jgi:cytochrome c oxidase subunit 3